MKKKDVKTNLLNHSEAKVRLLGEYLKRYLNIICNDGYTKRIKIYDLFCGEGLYENGGEGSPIVTMRQVKDIHFVNVAKFSSIPKIDCHFNDIEENNQILETAKELISLGIKSKDALHVACAIEGRCDFFLTTDDRVLKKLADYKKIAVVNPVTIIVNLKD